MATTPPVYTFPVRRFDMLVSAYWNGNQGDAELDLQVNYLDASGIQRAVTFQAGGDYPPNGNRGICLPATNKDPGTLHRDVLVSHVRMAAFLANAVMGTKEFTDAIVTVTPENAINFQTALGAEVQCTGVERLSETNYRLSLYCKNGQTRTLDVGHDEISAYVFAPSTQLLTLGGHLKKVLGYIHDAPGDLLTQTEMDRIVACIMHTGTFAPGGADADKAWVPFV